MHKTAANFQDTIIVFSPFRLENIKRCVLGFDFDAFDDRVKIFFITKLFCKPNISIGLFHETLWDGNESKLTCLKNWISLEINKNVLTLEKLRLKGEMKEISSYHVIWIFYDFDKFSQCEISSTGTCDAYSDRSYFKYFKTKINEKITKEQKKKVPQFSEFTITFLSFLNMIILKLSNYNLKQYSVSKYFNVALHIDNYLSGFGWAVKSFKIKKKLDIKVMNFLLSVVLDMFLGVVLLKWLNSKISLDSSLSLFLLTAESIVNSIKDLINWLRGDPAGLKLNRAFNKVLATFFSFHIDIWWTFIGYLKPLVKIIFQVFLQLGLLGVTFQASITADLLALVSFHVYCIYAYAAKLYGVQISSLMSLWRLFIGRKKNPLRGKVDSCKYTPEQLFVGTLGFTVLLFLLPTTLLYYIVFTCIRLSILIMQAMLLFVRHLNQSLPVYSTILWLTRSPKISIGIEMLPYDGFLKSDIILMQVKPVMYSWWETVKYFRPDPVPDQEQFNFSDLLGSLVTGKLIFPI